MVEQIRDDLFGLTTRDIKCDALRQFIDEYRKCKDHLLLIRVTIRSNHVVISNLYSAEDCETHKVRTEGIKIALLRLAECIQLPNVDFLISLHDDFSINLPIPVFGFAKNPHLGKKTILMPDFEALRGNMHFLNAVRVGNERHPWPSKIHRALFRGSLTGGDYTEENFLQFPRTKAVSCSLKFPFLVDARFYDPQGEQSFKTHFSQYFGSSMSVEDQIVYKYQLLIDGNSCAYSRAYWQLFSNCVILKQNSPNIQWYYRAISPFVHFIPVNEDMSNLPEMVYWAVYRDSEAQKISEQAQQFARENLNYARVLQYFYLLLVEYAALQNP